MDNSHKSFPHLSAFLSGPAFPAGDQTSSSCPISPSLKVFPPAVVAALFRLFLKYLLLGAKDAAKLVADSGTWFAAFEQCCFSGIPAPLLSRLRLGSCNLWDQAMEALKDDVSRG